jgi:hypothetical protein
MKNRSIPMMILLTIVTLGLYFIYWFYTTTVELRQKGATVPFFLWFFIPFVNIWWTWKYSEAVESVTSNKLSGVLAFILLFIGGFIGIYIVQHFFNQIAPIVQPVAGMPTQPATFTATTPANAPGQNPNPPAPIA